MVDGKYIYREIWALNLLKEVLKVNVINGVLIIY